MRYSESVLPVMRAIRDMLLPEWGVAKAVHQKTASSWSVVTALDIEIEKFVSAELAHLHPDIEFVGEEQGGNRSAKKFWLMDPIDGTAHFIRGLPFCTSMLALVDRGHVVFSAIYDFIHDEMYFADKGKGAFCNEKKLSVSSRTLKDSFVSFETDIAIEKNANLRQKMLSQTNVMTTFCAGWEFAMVASGKIDARICLDPFGQDYDFAPGTLLVMEAGGVVTNLDSHEFDYTNLDLIAANPLVYKDLTEGESALFPLGR
ncbi:MAG: myo-inositol-1(or 4)-monophosphatase [Parcubacteria group bacterium Gr01-1014_8]|nr:MAG: myo-inositol-1(or 4)-monophosphatase [Parcubacteria group bacterium Gr01-1014_8]